MLSGEATVAGVSLQAHSGSQDTPLRCSSTVFKLTQTEFYLIYPLCKSKHHYQISELISGNDDKSFSM